MNKLGIDCPVLPFPLEKSVDITLFMEIRNDVRIFRTVLFVADVIIFHLLVIVEYQRWHLELLFFLFFFPPLFAPLFPPFPPPLPVEEGVVEASDFQFIFTYRKTVWDSQGYA